LPQRRTLVVAEAIGTGRAFAVGDGPVGVHPMLRLTPPRRLGDFAPEHLLVGHGPPLHGTQTPSAITVALERSRRDLPQLLRRLPALLRAAQGTKHA
jgi:hypothetical protein